MLNPKKKYNLEYYMSLVEKLVAMNIHILGIKDMAGVLKPKAATLLIGSIRKKYPDLPIHVHTHDSAGTGVASMVACAQAGADAVDTATDSLSGLTSQPSVGAVLASLEGSDYDPGLNVHHVRAIDTYWSQLRLLYSPFEAGLHGPDPDVYDHEIPGGQLTNMMFQASQLGLGAQWAETKKAYEQANDLLVISSRLHLHLRSLVTLLNSWFPTNLTMTLFNRELVNWTSQVQFLNSSKV